MEHGGHIASSVPPAGAYSAATAMPLGTSVRLCRSAATQRVLYTTRMWHQRPVGDHKLLASARGCLQERVIHGLSRVEGLKLRHWTERDRVRPWWRGEAWCPVAYRSPRHRPGTSFPRHLGTWGCRQRCLVCWLQSGEEIVHPFSVQMLFRDASGCVQTCDECLHSLSIQDFSRHFGRRRGLMLLSWSSVGHLALFWRQRRAYLGDLTGHCRYRRW